MSARIASFLRNLLRKRTVEQALDDELQSAVELLTQEKMEEGLSHSEARRQAVIELGGIEQVKEKVRAVRFGRLLETFAQDLRYGLRMLRRSPGFTAVAVLTLALGIGANTVIFSLINGILMRALPVRDAQSLVVLRWTAHRGPAMHNSSSYGDCGRTELSRQGESSSCSFSEPFFNDVDAHVGGFSRVAAFANAGQLDLSGNGTASIASSQAISGDFFPTLGVRAAAGRLIVRSDDSISASPVAVLNYGYWQSQFGGSQSVIGKTVRLNDVPFTIIGVADPRFDSLSPGRIYDIWIPFSALSLLHPGTESKARPTDIYTWWLVIIGRLKPGIARLQAQAEVSTLFRNEMLHGERPLSKPDDDPRIVVLPAQSGLDGSTREIAPIAYVLMMTVGIILLIACANVAGLLLSRAIARQKEIAMRLALGAGRRTIVRQLLTESVLLSLVGGGLGILFAVWGKDAIVSLIASGSSEPFAYHVSIDVRVLAFTFAMSLLTGIVFGLAPAFHGTRIDLTPALKENPRNLLRDGGQVRGWLTLRDGLVVAQVTLAVVVLMGAGLLVRTLQNLRNVDPGFDTRNLLTFQLNPMLVGYKTPQIDSFYRNLQERLGALPGVQSVSYSSDTLLSGSLWSTGFHLQGTPKDQESQANYLQVGADFFSTMHMRLLAGRNFTSNDFAGAEVAQENATAREAAQQAKEAGTALLPGSTTPPASAANEAPVPVIVNKTFVQRYFSKINPLGQRFGEQEADRDKGNWAIPGWVIVGVVSDAKYQDLRTAIEPTMYVPASGRSASFELRTAANPAAMSSTIRGVVKQMDSNLPVFNLHTQTELIDQLLFSERMVAQLSGFFGVLALLLACIGLYGLLSYEVSRRTREIGIRVALGARRGDVLRLVVGHGIVLVLAGLVPGLGVALGVTHYLNSMLYGVHANDPATIIGVGVLLGLVALVACYIPTRRALGVDPMIALRYE